MKKTVLGLIFFIIATLSVSAQYFDVGVGIGVKRSNYNYNQVYTNGDFPLAESFWGARLDLGLRGGFGPLGNIPVYLVAEAEGGWDWDVADSEKMMFYGFIGAGVIFYPKPSFQIGTSLGALWTNSILYYTNYISNYDYQADAGFAWNISAAYCIEYTESEGQFGLKYSGVINNFNYDYSCMGSYYPLYSGNGNGTRLVSYFTLFFKWGFRKATLKEIAALAEKAEKEKQEGQKRRRERLVAEERGRQLSAIEREEIRRQVREELQSTYPGIDGAIGRAGQKLINGLPEKTRIAVINILSNNGEMSAYVAEELEYQLVSSGKFTMVDRNRLATIRAEQNFQMSGEVSDESAVGIGHMLGANIVLTGSISGVGASQRISISALNVRTGEIILMVREEF